MAKALLIGVITASLGTFFVNLFQVSDALNLNIPFEGMKGRVGRVVIKVLDPEDSVLGSAYHLVFVSKDYYSLPVKIKLSKKPEDYDLLRVQVIFGETEKVYSLHQLQDRMIVKILGQNEFIKGTPINYRIIVRNQRTNEAIEGADIKVMLRAKDSEQKIFEGKTDNSGTCNMGFDISEDIQECELSFEIASQFGHDKYETKIKITSGNITYLVTDKPIYQPSQTIHIRSLSLHKPGLSAVKGGELVFEVEDSKGNKVFKKAVRADDFGVGYVQFLLADEVNLGDYTIRVILDGEKVEKTVKVERYVLPKFKIVLTTEKEFYLPGEKMEGDIEVQYFFGKPVSDGRVKITVYKFDIGFNEEAVIEGKTDESGKYHFTYALPDYFVGEPLEKGDAFVRLDIEVIDNANHSEKISSKKKVVQDVISLSIVPEGGSLKPNLENRIYVLATYPDGMPCNANIEMKIDDQKMSGKTDGYGVAEFVWIPKDSKTKIEVTAKDEKGETAKMEKEFSLDIDRDQIIMRMLRGIYKVGEAIELQFLTNKKTGRAYLDVIKDNQTVLTKSIDIANGKGSYRLNLSPELSGSIWLHAYIVTPGSDIVRDTRFCYVHAANDLTINVKPDKNEYLPGEDGEILFTVTDRNGRPRIAALCIAIVDEAVFAVSELQPGLEKVYFTLEKEILQPRYEIHGFKPMDIVKRPGIEPRAENVMFSTLTPKEPFPVNYTTPQEVDQKIRNTFYQRLSQTKDRIYAAINKYYERHNEYPKRENALKVFINEGFIKEKDLLDPWKRRYRITSTEEYLYDFTIVSAGPDGVFDNEDDISEQWRWRAVIPEEDRELIRLAAPAAGVVADRMLAKQTIAISETKAKKLGEEPRVREYFPETFIFEPALITDYSGKARLSVPMPDAITTWRLTASASTQNGELGSTISQIRVFQDFFVDIDLPVALTEGDEISIAIALYNYLPKEQGIKVVLQKEEWFDVLENTEINKTLKKDEVSVVYFPIKVKKIGAHSILVKAYGEVKSDAIKRQITILPDGKRFEDIISDRLTEGVIKKINFPKNGIKDANSLILKIFPGVYSQVVEGLDKLLGIPFGCFEQTSSVTYPNILVLNYLRQTNQIKPETEMRAEEYISIGYQRLLSFEVKGGGFSWFGDEPANKVLTAYGLMEFNDMAKVYEIDARVTERTAQWLKNQQNRDGSWSPDKQYLHEESWGRIQHNEVLPTAYICWALGEVGEKGDAVLKGLSYLKKNLSAINDPYIMALVANAFVAVEPKSETTTEVLKKLVDMAREENGAIYWESNIPSITFTRGKGADIEATGLAAYALVKSGRYGDVVSKVLTYLIRSKDASGLWYTTQGTIIALRSLIVALGGIGEEVNAQITVIMNGEKVKELKIDKGNADVMHQIDLKENLKGDNTIEINVKGEGNFLYELVSAYYIPWHLVPKPPVPPFIISVNYDRTKLAINDLVNVDVDIKITRPGTAQMVIVDLGIPPGFEVQTPTLDEHVGKKIQKYSLTPRQIIIYLDEVSSGKPVSLAYSLKAKYPIKAKIQSSRVYEYYNTTDEGIEAPIEMRVSLEK